METTVPWMTRPAAGAGAGAPLGGGGPGRATEVLALYAYNTVFRNFDLSNGSVIAVVLLLISIAFTLLYVRMLPKES